MRNVFVPVALVVAVVGGLGFVQRAEAGVSYQLVFRSTDILGGALNGVGGGTSTFSFSAFGDAHGCNAVTGAGCPVTDVMLLTSNGLFFGSISVSFENTFQLDVASADEWSGTLSGIHMFQNLYAPIVPGVVIGSSSIGSFDGQMPLPNSPPSLTPGTYNIGTIVWDTSALTANSALGFFLSALDATGAVLPQASGNKVEITGTEILIPGGINIIPEPSTATLVALGLTGMALAARRCAQRSGSGRQAGIGRPART